jgi:hypothetical protein
MESVNHPRRAFVKGALAVSALGLLVPTEALAAGWALLGTRTVRLSNDLDIVPVTFLSGSFTHLQLRVHGNAVTMNELRVRFSNGQWATLPVGAHIRDGGRTRAIPLPGLRRFISIIELRYRSAPNSRGRATVEIWGLK